MTSNDIHVHIYKRYERCSCLNFYGFVVREIITEHGMPGDNPLANRNLDSIGKTVL